MGAHVRKSVVVARIEEDDLSSFYVEPDIGDEGKLYYPCRELAEYIMEAIPEYVYAYHENMNIPQGSAVRILREAARSIYKIKEFELARKAYLENDQLALQEIEGKNLRSGEFGEILLHVLLRDFKQTIPLISKVYFKDSVGVPAHGFDAVHVSPNDKVLWLGESKFYSKAKDGLDKLIEDLNKHINKDYLDEQFLIIKKQLLNSHHTQRDEWIEVLSHCDMLKEKLNIINIPLLCTYPDATFYQNLLTSRDREAFEYHETSIRDLKDYFENCNKIRLRNYTNIVLFLFPVRDKVELVKELHMRLFSMQNI